ncbi:MAG: hypothetical protein ACLPZJ_17035 [Terriglobales bacterium]
MSVRFRGLGVAVLIGFTSLVRADDIQTHVTYVCNGEHLFVDSCNMRDLSDTSTCMVAHPDKMRPNGFPTYTNETRGTLKKLLPTCQQPSAQSVARVQAAQKKANDAYNAAVNPPKPATPPISVTQNGQPNSSPNLNLTGVSGNNLSEARCIVSGRNANLCGENELGSWFEGAIANGVNMANAMLPGSADTLKKATNKLPPGLEISGNYTGAGNWVLQFDDRSAMTSCGTLAPQQRFYKIETVNGQFEINIEMTPKPLILHLRPDGTLANAGPMVVNGVVVAGSSGGGHTDGKWVTSTSTTTQPLTPAEAQQYSGDPNLHYNGGAYYDLNRTTTSTSYQPGSYTAPTINYAPKTETCAQAILKNSGKTQVDALKGITESMLLGSQTPTGPAGLRMHGAYIAPTGLSVEFFPESAILGCGAAIKAYPYTIQAMGGQATVRVDAPKPLVIAIKLDNTLDPGSGQYEVQGKRIVGKTQDGDFAAAAATETCSLAVLKPGTITAANMTSANNPSSMSPQAGAPTGSGVLSLAAFPAQTGASNPLAGHLIFLLKDSMDNVLRKQGMQLPAGKTPVQAWDAACVQKAPACQQMVAGLKPYVERMAKANDSGKATFSNLPDGSYYVFTTSHNANPALAWDASAITQNRPVIIT